MNIFVGNLSFGAKEADLYKAFAAFGTVAIVAIVMEKKGKKSRGFGFVEMPLEQEAQSAIAALHGKELLGRPINVMPALPKKPKDLTRRSHKPQGDGLASNSQSHKPQPGVEKQGSFFRPKAEGHSRHDPAFRRTGRYKEGRRSLSYVKRRSEAGIVQATPARKDKDNPMRWRKKPSSTKPWRKISKGAQDSRFKRRSNSVSHKP